MRKVFIDTNITIDFLADRQPFSKYALNIFNLSEKNQIELFMSSSSFVTLHYILKKIEDEKVLRLLLLNLLDYINIIPVTDRIIIKGLKSDDKDFEDAIQIHCSYTIEEMDCIVTRNIKDFRKANIAVYTPEDFLDGFNKTKNL